jgi:membrane protein implicated in regulation of membrane protease activity
MGLDATARRRWFGGISLLAAVVLLIGGETILRGRLVDLGFVIYWLACFGFTGLALMAAILDARAVRRRIHDEHRKLLESTIKKIEIQGADAPPVSEGNERPSNLHR